ncbi:MAG: GlcNAc-transferase family protein [Candidatus Neomarinimicrobiota bacterium]
MKIFISIASYQDPMLEITIKSAYENASFPENLIFGVCDQSEHPINLDLLSFSDNIHYDHVDPVLSKGTCWARERVQKFFNNEEYYLQIDSHMLFEPSWDKYMISYIEKIKNEGSNNHNPPIISCYPRGFEIINFEEKKFSLNSSDKSTYALAFRENAIFLNGSYCGQKATMTDVEIVHGYLIAAGCLFSTKEFVQQVPYDKSFYFYGEEQSISLRAFTRGFGIYHIPATPIYHLYNDAPTNVDRKLHWDKDEDSKRGVKWHERDKLSIDRLTDLINDDIEGVYGLGNKRTLKEYEYLSGVNLKDKIVSNEKKAYTSDFISSLQWRDEIFKKIG